MAGPSALHEPEELAEATLRVVTAQALSRGEDVERLRTQRRDDLTGRRLVWQVALRNVVAELTDDRRLAVR